MYVDQHLDSIFTRERVELYLVLNVSPSGYCATCGEMHEYYTVDCRPALFALDECPFATPLTGPFPPDTVNDPRYARVGVTPSLLPRRFNNDGTPRSES